MYLSNDVMIHPQGDPDPVNTLPSSVSGDQRWLRLRYRDIDCWLSHPAPAIAGHEPHICQNGLFPPGHWLLCVHFVELNKYTAISNISKSCETREKLWKFCERLDLLVKKMVRGRFADIWEDLMGFLENRFTWCFGCCSTDKPMALGAGEMEQEKLFAQSLFTVGHVSPHYNHIKTLAASDVNTWI